ncbi:MAG: hypothetical protein ACLVJ6_08770 [Merdibacter sp.]
MLFITIGLGFIFINLNINDIQIVPSFVGYLLIALGSSQLKRESVYFRRILPAAIVMTVINVWSYLMSLMTASEWSGVVSDLYQTIFWVILLLILSAILQLFITYCLAKGVLEMEKTHRCDLGGHRLLQLWQAVAVLVILSTCWRSCSSRPCDDRWLDADRGDDRSADLLGLFIRSYRLYSRLA